jgi:hypothetical protein
MAIREDEFDRCVEEHKLRDARERIRERDERINARRVLDWTLREKKPLDRILELRRVDTNRYRVGASLSGR